MNKNNFIIAFLNFLLAAIPPIGGQAVLGGVMMRNGDIYALAVRLANGKIIAERHHWRSLLVRPWLRLPFVRGFPILLETIFNGIHALNRSATLYEESEYSQKAQNVWGIILSVFLALLMAVALFIIAPHLLSLLMLLFGAGGDVEGITFHLWDGFFKCLIFGLYLWLISFIPDIHHVFQYHGAEHKTIHAWETGESLDSNTAFFMSRLHPRCGTTFLLFVICISIIIQALFLPFILHFWAPQGMVAKHAYSLFIKLFLIVPISAASYEIIRFAAHLQQGLLSSILQWPGLALQRLTTREPTKEQMEVALIALAEAAGTEESEKIHTAPYSCLSGNSDE